jgi:hypothetical protein
MKIIITEEEKDEILGQHKDDGQKLKFKNFSDTDKWDTRDIPTGRRMLDADLTPMTLAKIKSKGLTPYYINDMDLIELSGPLKQKASWDYKPTEVFLFSPDDYDKIKKLSDNIKEMIELKKKQIELYKQYIPSVAIELTKKK